MVNIFNSCLLLVFHHCYHSQRQDCPQHSSSQHISGVMLVVRHSGESTEPGVADQHYLNKKISSEASAHISSMQILLYRQVQVVTWFMMIRGEDDSFLT